MKYKKVDKMLFESLNSAKPSDKVLDQAKAYMLHEGAHRSKRNYKWLYATASCAVIVVLLTVLIVHFAKGYHSADKFFIPSNSLKTEELSSIKSVYGENGVLYYDFEVQDCKAYKDKKTNNIIYIAESYLLPPSSNATMLTVYLVEESYISYTIEDLELFNNLSNTYTYKDTQISYEELDIFYFSFKYGDFCYNFSVSAPNEAAAKDLVNLLLN